MRNLNGRKVAILATNGFEHSELLEPLKALRDAGAAVDVISPESGSIKSWLNGDWGESVKVDHTLSEVSCDDYNALVLPGGVINPDLLRKNKDAVNFVKGFTTSSEIKPIAAICHGPWMLAEAGLTKGRKMTSYDSIRTDIENSGANWVDKEVVVDNGIVTSRSPKDLPAFIKKTIEEIDEGRHKKKSA